MAKTSTKARAARVPKFASRVVRRCFRCGRKRGYMRDFRNVPNLFPRTCERRKLPGIKKSSW